LYLVGILLIVAAAGFVGFISCRLWPERNRFGKPVLSSKQVGTALGLMGVAFMLISVNVLVFIVPEKLLGSAVTIFVSLGLVMIIGAAILLRK